MKILKWIAVLPSSLLVLILANLAYRYLDRIEVSRNNDENSLWGIIFVDFMSCAIASGAYVYVGAFVAPSYKRETALFLTILLSIMAGASLMFFSVFTTNYLSIVGIVASIIGAVVVYFEVERTEKVKRQKG